GATGGNAWPARKALDSAKMRHKRPFRSPSISLERDLSPCKKPHERTQDHPRTRPCPRPQAGRVCAHFEADRASAELHRAWDLLGDVGQALLVQILAHSLARFADEGALGD